jgi:adenylate kinase
MSIPRDRAAWLKGGEVQCNTQPPVMPNARRLVLLGAPGVGKGTQAELLSSRLGACQLSTGDVFRAAKTLNPCELSPSMTQALDYMKKGELVPDVTVLNMIRERGRCLRCGGGFLLDGFPRTVAQAEALDRIFLEERIRLDAVVNYDLPIEQIVSRISGRRTCSKCKAVYHIETRPARRPGICDHCGSNLLQREDDRPEAVRVRMEAYEQSTAPLASYYSMQGILLLISADGSPAEIFERTMKALNSER